MGRWVTTSQGRRLYIPDEGEENPYSKTVDKDIAEKDRQIAANKSQATERNRSFKATVVSRQSERKQAGKQAIEDAKAALKQYGPKRGQWVNFDKANEAWTKISKAFAEGKISREDYEKAYSLYNTAGAGRFFGFRRARQRQKDEV